MVPGRPRRQQQAYRRANTNLTLLPTGEPDSDPYISCSSILDKFSNGNKDTSNAYMANGSSPIRKSSVGIKDFLLGRSSVKDSASKDQPPSDLGQWNHDSVIDELRISTIPRQPKYSYLIGKQSQKDDFWRKSNAVSIVNNNVYSRPVASGTSDYYLPQHNSSSSKRLNDYQNHNNSASSAAYEDRISTALRKANSNSSTSSAVQKSKSYSNFDFVRRDLNFQVKQSRLHRCL